MKSIISVILILTFTLLSSCTISEKNRQIRTRNEQHLLTKTLLGEPTEVKTVAIVFDRMYSIPELENLLSNSNLELEAWRYYSGGISGTMTF